MAIRKWSKLQLNRDARIEDAGVSHVRTSKLSDFQFNPEPGFLYVTTRAISSRVNANYDGWPPEELRNSYRTFIGRPVFVDHNNWNVKDTHGVIIDAKLYENKLASGHEDVWVELLIEVDAQAFPKLAQNILTGDIDAVSMGADVEYTVCSVCGNQAHDVLQYCAHIPQMKGREVETWDKTAGNKIRKLCYEDCYGVSFFEISFVFDPADESALISDVMLAPKAARTLGHVRKPKETLAAYSERLGTSMMKVASVQMPDFCTTCGGTDLAISKSGAKCRDCGVEKRADKVLMSLPQEVDTLRDELNCPQCGSEWNGMVCLNCGFELPPEGLGDPVTDPAQAMGLPMGPPGDQQGDQGEDEDAPSSDDSGNDAPDDQGADDSKSKPKSDKGKKKSGHKEELSVSRYEDLLRKQATLPQDPPYRQDTSPAQSVPGYGEAIPGGNPPAGFEQALEPAPAAPAVVQDLDAPDVQGPVGQSAVVVVQQPAGPTDVPPPGSQAGEAFNLKGASKEEKRAAFYLARAKALRERADEFEKKADAVTWTDVRNLDEPPAVDVGPDATSDLLKAVEQGEQLALADTTDVINDGAETGLPAGPDFRERLPQQINPFNDVALRPYGASVKEASDEEITASVDEAAEERAHVEQRIAAAKTRVLRVANFVDERIELGLTKVDERYAEVAKFEAMDDAALDGYIQATREFKAKEMRVASKRVPVVASTDRGPIRMPSLGSVSASVVDEDDPADDYAVFL